MKTKLIGLFLFLFVAKIAFTQTESTSNTVYITNKGSKYHKSGCSYLKSSKIESNLSEVKQSHGPCSKCFGTNTNRNNVSGNSSKKEGSPTYNSKTPSRRTIHTGPRGGKYYINSSGKKVYVK